jgi:hypothetical protein
MRLAQKLAPLPTELHIDRRAANRRSAALDLILGSANVGFREVSY